MLYYRVDNIKESLRLFLGTVHAICEVIDTPRSLAVSLMLQYQEWQEYLDLSIDPSMYEDPQHFAEDYLVTEILRKSEDLPLGIDRDAVALKSFKDSETACYATNVRLRSSTRDWFFQLRRIIQKLLGPLDEDALEFIQDNFKFGPGATTGVPGMGSTMSEKFDKELHLTADLIPFLRSVLGENWWEHQRRSHTIVEGNKFATVPKSWKTNRGICVEPTLNIYMQLGIGALIRRRLKRFGVDLNSQERNRKLAGLAYTAKLATIDLSAASDSLSTELVLQFFPQDWIELLALPRSAKTLLPDGSSVELEKWSSMGNGYTFELETLVFYSVCMLHVPFEDLSMCNVFGDDIIVPAEYAPSVVETLEYLGFSVNPSKSYLAGNFFESCGHDYFKGVNVRPFYLKSEKEKIPFQVQTANKLRLWSRRMCQEVGCDIRYRPLWQSLVAKAPREWRKTGVPLEAGDAGVIKNYDEAWRRRPKGGAEGSLYRYIAMNPVKKESRSYGVILAALSGRKSAETPIEIWGTRNKPLGSFIEAVFSKGREPRRGYLGRPMPKLAICNRWTDGLCWITW